MDFQHRPGGKTGTGGVASGSESNRDRRERLRQLALETIDLNKDPYFMKNHLGSYECKLCLTLHTNEGSYLAHTQGKKHQANLARRAAKDAKEAPAQMQPVKPHVDIKKFIKIGRPGYKVTKQRDPTTKQQSLLFQIDYPEIADNIVPRHRFMSAYEQRIEPPDRRWQYLLFAAEPYETIAFKVPSRELDKDADKFWTYWNKDTLQFFLQFSFKLDMRMPIIYPEIQMNTRLPLKPIGPPPPPPIIPTLATLTPEMLENKIPTSSTTTTDMLLNADDQRSLSAMMHSAESVSQTLNMPPPPPPPPPPSSNATMSTAPPPPPPATAAVH